MYDVLVAGGGPAGSSVARQLAVAGARVALVAGATTAGREGLSARAVALLRAAGLEPAAAGLGGPVARRGEWGEGRAVSGLESLADRVRLAACLRQAAIAAGVEVRAGTVSRLARGPAGFVAESAAAGRLRAREFIDARGRRGSAVRGPLLLALGQAFRCRARRPSGTSIHAQRAGWCWLVAEPDRLWIQLIGRPRTGHPGEWLGAAARELPELAALLAQAEADGAPVARAAHARLGPPAAGAGHWRVGDAALALDPLSGQGVYEALRGAAHVATAVGCVLGGGDRALAERFVTERQQDGWRRSLGAAAALYAENAARGTFWSATAAAYAALAPAPRTSGPVIERHPVLDHGRIRERAVLVTAEAPRGVWLVDGVPLVELLEYLRQGERATASGAALALDRPLAAIESAVRWLRASGALPAGGSRPISVGG